MNRVELDSVTFRPAKPTVRDGVSRLAGQFWEIVTPDGSAIGTAEVFVHPERWGVRLFDQVPQVDPSDLVRVVARLLVWHARCPTETVELKIMRRDVEPQELVRVSGDYV